MRSKSSKIEPCSHPKERTEELNALLVEIAAEAAETQSYTGRASFSPKVMDAIARVPRECFLSADQQALAYLNASLPIGYRQTISQPYIVALMTDFLDMEPGHRVLEIGTGSGYQTAVLLELGAEVYGIEIIPQLLRLAAERLQKLGYENFHLREGDGGLGWPDAAPFDRVLCAAAAASLPGPLIEQLSPAGRMVLPLSKSPYDQVLTLIEKSAERGVRESPLLPVAFVPLTGAASG
jgi:protein-L-isoaspartate(D-aspartate) O-methyltransferase